MPYSLVFLNWYIGEISTAVFVANIPLCWPLLRRVFKVGTFNDKRSVETNHGCSSHPQRHIGNGYSRRIGIGQRLPSDDETGVGFSESEEGLNTQKNWIVGKETIVLGPVGIKKTRLNKPEGAGKYVEGSIQESEDGIAKTVLLI